MQGHQVCGVIRRIIRALSDGARAFGDMVAPRGKAGASDPAWRPRSFGDAYQFPGAGRIAGFM